MTEYVVTRWYRAPELLLSCETYDAAIDVWSVGCILAELLGRKPLLPGKDYIDQIKLITDVLGTPADEDLLFIQSSKARNYLKSQPHQPRKPWATLFPSASAPALDLLSQMLVFDPNKRITVEAALKHPYLASLHDPKLEPVCEASFEFDFEDQELKEDMLRERVWDEILKFHPEPLPAK